MNLKTGNPSKKVLAGLNSLLPELEALYTDVHAHPELSMQETRTAGLAADHLRKAGYDVVTGIGGTGVVGLLRNGEAIIKLNVRTFDAGVRKRVLAAIERIANAEAAASGAPRPPEFTSLDHYPLGFNDAVASKRVGDAFRQYFDQDRVRQVGAAPASEDFGSFGTAWGTPSMFWFVGGTDPEVYAKAKAAGEINKIPTNHSPYFAPVMHPTLEAGVEAMVVAALAWLAAPTAVPAG